MNVRFFLCTSLCLQLLCAVAQRPLHFQKTEGLSQSTVYAIQRDRQGFLWVATGNGLNRYDGVEMNVYKPSLQRRTGEMKGRVIRSHILEDDGERLWFATDLATHCFTKRSGRFTVLGEAEGVKRFANPLLIDGGHLWLANADDGVFDLDLRIQKATNYPLTQKDEAGNVIRLMYHGVSDRWHRLWFASNKGLLCFDRTTRRWQRFLAGHSLYSLSIAGDTLWVSEGKSMRWFSTRSLQGGRFPLRPRAGTDSADVLHCVYTDPAGNVWAGDESGNVYRKLPSSAGFVWAGNVNGNELPHSHYPVYCFYADPAGVLWAGTYTLGLLRAEIDGDGFTNYAGDAARDLYVNTVFEDRDGRVWMGTFENGIVVLDKATGKAVPLHLPYRGPKLIYGNSVPLICEDAGGNVWTSLSGFLFVRERGRSRFKAIKMPAPSNALQVPQLWSLAGYKGGWLVGTTVGLYFVSKEKRGYAIRHLPRFGQNRIFAIWVSPQGQVWLAYESGGVTVIDNLEGGGREAHLFPEANVRAFLYNEQHKLLWLSTTGGLLAFHLPSGRFQNFTEDDGLLSSYLSGALANGEEELWVGSNNGLSKATLSFPAGAVLPAVRFTNFTPADGLPDHTINPRAMYKSRDGCFYLGTPKGITCFQPQQVMVRQDVPVVRLVNVLVNDAVADSTTAPEYLRQLTLSYRENNLSFRFRGLTLHNPEKVRYAYRLLGWDAAWVYSNNLNEVRYSNLPPGRYAFAVKAANGSGIWSTAPCAVSFTIEPPFWRTQWFYALATLAVLAVAVFVTREVSQRKLRRQLRALEKQRAVEAERNRISKDMHDEIGSGLTHIALSSELLQLQQKSPEEMKKEAGDISASARRLVQSLSEIIWALNPRNDTLENLLAYLREQAASYFEPFDLACTVDFPEEVPPVSLSNEQRRNLFLVAKEALHNALKHSGASALLLHMEICAGAMCFCIRDNGHGFDAGKTRVASNGLKNMQRRMEEISGRFELKTDSGGTEIVFSLPLESRSKSLGHKQVLRTASTP